MKKLSILVMVLVALCIPTVVFADGPGETDSTQIDIDLTTDGDINADINLDAGGDTNLTINGVEPFITVHEYSYSSYVSIYDDTALKATIAGLKEIVDNLELNKTEVEGNISIIVESVTNLIKGFESTKGQLEDAETSINTLREIAIQLDKMDKLIQTQAEQQDKTIQQGLDACLAYENELKAFIDKLSAELDKNSEDDVLCYDELLQKNEQTRVYVDEAVLDSIDRDNANTDDLNKAITVLAIVFGVLSAISLGGVGYLLIRKPK